MSYSDFFFISPPWGKRLSLMVMYQLEEAWGQGQREVCVWNLTPGSQLGGPLDDDSSWS